MVLNYDSVFDSACEVTLSNKVKLNYFIAIENGVGMRLGPMLSLDPRTLVTIRICLCVCLNTYNNLMSRSFLFLTGAHFKKWLIMQSKIKSGAVNEVFLLYKLFVRHFLYLFIKLNLSSSPTLHMSVIAFCSMQYKKEVGVMFDVAQSYLKSKTSMIVVDNANVPPGSDNQETMLTYTDTI